MAPLKVTIVGLNLDEYVMSVVLTYGAEIRSVNLINTGMLGNFRTLTYELAVNDSELLKTRRDILNELTRPGSPVTCMYEHGAICNIYIFQKTAFKNRA